MSKYFSLNTKRISVEILVPGEKAVNMGGLLRYLDLTSPMVDLRVVRQSVILFVVSSVESL